MPIKSVPQYAAYGVAALGDNTLVAAVAGKKIRVISVLINGAGGTNTVQFQSGAGGTALTGIIAVGNTELQFNGFGWFETGVGDLLNLELGIATLVAGVIVYEEVDDS